MKNMRRCLACGRRRKPGHEKRAGTDLAYTPQCRTEEAWQKEEAEKARQAAERLTENIARVISPDYDEFLCVSVG